MIDLNVKKWLKLNWFFLECIYVVLFGFIYDFIIVVVGKLFS